MSTDFTAALHRKAKLEPDSDGDVAIASIWLVFNLLMIVGALFVKRDGLWVPLALFAAILCGWVVLGWRKQKKADGIVKSRAPHIAIAARRKRSAIYRKAAAAFPLFAGGAGHIGLLARRRKRTPASPQ